MMIERPVHSWLLNFISNLYDIDDPVDRWFLVTPYFLVLWQQYVCILTKNSWSGTHWSEIPVQRNCVFFVMQKSLNKSDMPPFKCDVGLMLFLDKFNNSHPLVTLYNSLHFTWMAPNEDFLFVTLTKSMFGQMELPYISYWQHNCRWNFFFFNFWGHNFTYYSEALTPCNSLIYYCPVAGCDDVFICLSLSHLFCLPPLNTHIKSNQIKSSFI